MQHYDSPANSIETRSGFWVSEPEWPSANIVSKDLWLHSGRLQPEQPGDGETVPVPLALKVGAGAGDTGYFGRSGGLPLDQQSDDEHSHTFETEPLEEPLQILGSVCFQVSLCSDQPVATLVARLNDVAPGGETERVSYAIRNLATSDDGTADNRLRAGQTAATTIDFPNAAHCFAPGHRIRLAISSSYWPIIWPSPLPATLQLHLAHSRLTLPVRDHQECAGSVSFAEPMEVEGPAIRIISSPPLERRIDIDPNSGRRTIRWHQPLQVRGVYGHRSGIRFRDQGGSLDCW